MKKQHMTKAALALLTASMAFGSPVWAAETKNPTNTGTATNTASTASKQRFPDVPATHWANKHIAKLALLGIVEGNELGQYLPGSSVTQEQVITMLVRMLGWEEEAKALPAFASDLQVSEYAKPYLHMALEKGLIVYNEELGTSGTGWGTRNATREWVAKLVIKSIDKQDAAKELETQNTAFIDDSSISSWARGYINEAVELKIVNGLEDGSFKPANPVTRAEMATFLSRAGQYAGNTSISEMGIIDTVTGLSVSFVDDYGDQKALTLTADTVYYGVNQDTASTSAVLKQGSKVFFVVKNGTAVFAEVLEENAKSANILEGTLVSLDINAAQLVLATGSKEVTVQIQIPISIVDKDGKGLASSDLVKGSVVELERTGSRAKYSTMVVKHIPVNKTAEGVIQSVDLTNRKVSVLESSGTVVEYALADEVLYTDGGIASDISVIKARDKISYRIDTDLMTEITMITAYEPPHDIGKVLEIRSDKNLSYITLQKADGKFATYSLNSQLKIVIPGMLYTSYKDLETNDQVKVMLDDNNGVYEITVTNRSLQTEYMNTVVSYDADSKLLTVKNSNGVASVYELSDTTAFELYGTTATYSTGVANLVKGKRIDITASSDTNVRQIRIVTGYEGTVASVSALQGTLTLKMGEQHVTLTLGSGVYIDIANVVNAKLANINVGDTVKVGLDSNLNAINRVQVVKSLVYRLSDKNVVNRQVTLKDELNSTITLTIPSSVKIYNLNQTEMALADMSLEDPYYFYYTGSTLEKVATASVSRGNVTTVDAASGKITLSEYGSAAKSVTVGVSAKVKREGVATLAALSDLKAGDRIEAVRGVDGSYTLYAAASYTRQVDYYDTANATLYVLRESLSENRNFTFHSKAYIHKGIITLAPANIVAKDNVTFYILNGKIIELEKK
jgi:trimeric autotransporter adhesin